MIERIERGVHEVAPSAHVIVAPVAPIVGAALLGLDQLGVSPVARGRASAELQTAFLALEGAARGAEAASLEPAS
jgi:hypothetical protein